MPVTIPYRFATASGNVPATQLDADFDALAAFTNGLETTVDGLAVDVATLEGAVLGFTNWGPSFKGFGAIGNGTTDDTAAITAANGLNGVFAQTGNYLTTIPGTTFNGRFMGWGQVIDSGGFKRGPWFSAIKTAPTVRAPSNIVEWFSGDIAHVQIAMEHRITGADTLGAAAPAIYDYVKEASPIVGYLFNSSGQMAAAGPAHHRTAVSFMNIHVAQNGKGDVIGLTIAGVQDSPNPNADVLFGPNTNLLNGGLDAAVDGALMIVSEFLVTDNGFDIAATGHTVALNRTNATGAKNAYWYAFRGQSGGSQPVDALFSGFGPTRIGIDLTGITTQAAGTWIRSALTIAGNDRIYLNATAGAPPLPASATGTVFLTYDTAGGNIVFQHTGVSILTANASNVGVTGGLIVSGAIAATTMTASGTVQGASVVATGGLTVVGQAVTFGAADSAGAGFRQLRVPN